MFVRPVNRMSHRLARLAFLLAIVAALLVGAAGPLHRFFGVPVDFVFEMFRYGFYLAAAAVALGLATVVPTRPGDKRRGFIAAVLALALGIAAGWAPLDFFLRARAVPSLNDVSTDTANPPPLVLTLHLRQGVASPPGYPADNAALQHGAYPDIAPIVLAVPPDEAFKRVDKVAMALDWDVVARAPGEGRLEAVDTTRWFGFHDDIVVRIKPEGQGSRVDIRSKSRVGRSDLGVNAERIRAFAQRLKAQP